MDTDELLRKAWEAVEKAKIPASLQEVAFKEAVEHLSGNGGTRPPNEKARPAGRITQKGRPAKARAKARVNGGPTAAALPPVDEAQFFSRLADESGLPEQDLRDVLHVAAKGEVQVAPPTRKLGDSTVEQAQTVIALVASARAHGLRERPVNANLVRAELKRKGCYDPNNFAGHHLGPMKAFNAGPTKDQILVSSKWIDEFKAALDKAQERMAS